MYLKVNSNLILCLYLSGTSTFFNSPSFPSLIPLRRQRRQYFGFGRGVRGLFRNPQRSLTVTKHCGGKLSTMAPGQNGEFGYQFPSFLAKHKTSFPYPHCHGVSWISTDTRPGLALDLRVDSIGLGLYWLRPEGFHHLISGERGARCPACRAVIQSFEPSKSAKGIMTVRRSLVLSKPCSGSLVMLFGSGWAHFLHDSEVGEASPSDGRPFKRRKKPELC